MKLQNFIVIFIIIIVPIVFLMSFYISTGLKTLQYQALYDTGLLSATHDAIYAFEQNTSNDSLSGNPEVKKDILKSSVKMFEKSLSNTCNISSYDTDEIEEYIPAIVFGMYDGFYMYAPSYNSVTSKYEHTLKNYVYYSETLKNSHGEDVVITYSLDNYITVAGDFGEGYEIKKGYLMQINASNTRQEEGKEYAGIEITKEFINSKDNFDAQNYYAQAFKFTHWFLDDSGLKDIQIDGIKPFAISAENDPEDETSNFVKHKRKIIKDKIEGVLNSTITAYSERTWGRIYKMPKLLEEDWNKIYNNISMLTFFQGKSIGLTNYNGYCVANSTNSKEYVNPKLMYFIDENGEYHDIRCSKCGEALTLNGYRIGSFEKKKVEKLDEDGNIVYDADENIVYEYKYDHNELACYNCINGILETDKSIYDYVTKEGTGYGSEEIKTTYWTSLGRERYDPDKITPIDLEIEITFDANGGTGFSTYTETYAYNEDIRFPETVPTRTGYGFKGWSDSEDEIGNITSAKAFTDKTYYASWEPNSCTIVFDWGDGHETKTVPYDSQIYFPIPYKTGYNLAGWTKESNNSIVTDLNNEYAYRDEKYIAEWEPIKWTIKFDCRNGTIESEEITHGNSIKTYFPNPNNSDMVLKGWSKSEEDFKNGIVVNKENEIADSNKTYYACWGYNITFKYTEEQQENYIYAAGQKIDMPQNPEREGFEFVRWKDEAGNPVSGEQIADRNKIYTAEWKKTTYTITFDLNTGNGNIDTEMTVAAGEYITFPTEPDVYKDGYNLIGWNTDPSAPEGIKGINVIEDATYYAIWEIKKYTVIFDYNDGSNTKTEEVVNHGNSILFPSISRTGYELIGWNKDQSATTGITSATAGIGEAEAIEDKIYFYAIWKEVIYEIICDKQEGTGGTEKFYEKYGKGYYSNPTATSSITTIDIPTRANYTFEGYYTRPNGTETLIVNSEGIIQVGNTQFTSNSTIYAKWTAKVYEITCDSQGGTGGTGKFYEKYGEGYYSNSNSTSAITKIDVPTKANYTFEGYYTERNGAGTQIVNNRGNILGGNTQFTSDSRIYAKWTPNRFTATYDSNGGSGTMANSTHTYGEASKLRANTFTRSGYRFKGWSTSSTGNVEYEDQAEVTYLGITGTLNLYAVWEVDVPQPVFYSNPKINLNNISRSSRGKSEFTVSIDVNINNVLASNVSSYEISLIRNVTQAVVTRGTINSSTGSTTISFTYKIEDWDGSETQTYIIKIKAINSEEEHTEKEATFYISAGPAMIGMTKVDGYFTGPGYHNLNLTLD